LEERIEAAHAVGNYSFSAKPFIMEDAEAMRGMGSKGIKVFLDQKRNIPIIASGPTAQIWPT
jgi:hypothetical protein